MVYDPSIYRVFKSRADFRGSDVFELFPGEFTGKWWNEGSVYIREEGFEPFNALVRSVAPNFDWYGETRLRGAQLERFLAGLDDFAQGVQEARSAADLQRVDRLISVDDETFKLARLRLIISVEEIAGVVWQAWRRDRSLWILGL
jgi:hypothetical protein